MNSRTFVIVVLSLIGLIVYLFVSAPTPLPEAANISETIPIETAFAIFAAENSAVRTLYTKEIVGAGLKVGLRFDEDWRSEHIEAGPLPALFLRETAMSLEKDPARLNLFLGSDFPVRAANRFSGFQLEVFAEVKAERTHRFFYAEDTQMFTAMFPDVAVASACVTCHNAHPQSPKQDWKLNDIMGATTWMYPKASMSLDEFIDVLAALRKGFEDAYSAYLAKVATFANGPEIGTKWPRDGYYLPTVDVFMEEVSRRTSADTLRSLMNARRGDV